MGGALTSIRAVRVMRSLSCNSVPLADFLIATVRDDINFVAMMAYAQEYYAMQLESAYTSPGSTI
jgi:hypothetical protein